MEIRVLKYFLAAAREGSITAAAQALNITQPTLSRQIHELEDELGKKLFIRSSHSINLTEEGFMLRRRAEEIVELAEKAKTEISAPEDNVSGDIYIGGGETDAMKYIARIAGELRDDYPMIKYHLYSGNSEDVTERLDRGLLDFGVLIQPADLSKYSHIPLPAADEWGVLMRKDSPLASKKAVSMTDLKKAPLILSRQVLLDKSGANEFSRWIKSDIDSLNIAATYNLIYNASVMVGEGLGYAVTLDKLAYVGRDSSLCFRPLTPKLKSNLDLVWKKYRTFSRPAKLFLERVYAQFAGEESIV